jgi:hypothetical protein
VTAVSGSPESELSRLRLRRGALEERIEALTSRQIRVQELRSGGFADVTSRTLVELYRELGEIGRRIHSANLTLRSGSAGQKKEGDPRNPQL